jgi:hypothetical protein
MAAPTTPAAPTFAELFTPKLATTSWTMWQNAPRPGLV